MKEIWKDIIGYEGYYQISNYGNVRSLDRIDCKNRFRKGKDCKKILTEDGYYKAGLSKNGVEKRHFIHRLVALHFIENPNNLECVNHKDENKINNCVDNLEWCSREYNNNYGTRNKRIGEAESIKTAMIDKNTGCMLMVFNSAREAAKYIGGDESSICKVRNGRRKSAYGYRWEVVQ